MSDTKEKSEKQKKPNIIYTKIQMIKLMTCSLIILLPINLFSLVASVKLLKKVNMNEYEINFPREDDEHSIHLENVYYPIREGKCEETESLCQTNQINSMVLCSSGKCPSVRKPDSYDEFELYDVTDKDNMFKGFQIFANKTQKIFNTTYPVIEDNYDDEKNSATVSVNYYYNQTTVDLGRDVKKRQDQMNTMILFQFAVFIFELLILILITLFTLLGWTCFRSSIKHRYLCLKAVFNPFLIFIAFATSERKLEEIQNNVVCAITHCIKSFFIGFFTFYTLVYTIMNYFYFIQKLIIQVQHYKGTTDQYGLYQDLQTQINYDQQYSYHISSNEERLYQFQTAQYWLNYIDQSKICYESFILMKQNNPLLYGAIIANWVKILIFTLLSIFDQILLFFRYCRATIMFYVKDGDEYVPYKNEPACCPTNNYNYKPNQIQQEQLPVLNQDNQTPKNDYQNKSGQNSFIQQTNQNQQPIQPYGQPLQNLYPVQNQYIQQPYQNQIPIQSYGQPMQNLYPVQNQFIIQKQHVQQYYPNQYNQVGQPYYQPYQNNQFNQFNQKPQGYVRLQPIIINPTQNSLPSQQFIIGTQNQFSTQNF